MPFSQEGAPLATSWRAKDVPYYRQKSASTGSLSASSWVSCSPAGFPKKHKHLLRALQAQFLIFDPESTGLVPLSMLPRCLVAVGIRLPPGPLAAATSLIARPDRMCSWRALLRWLKANPELISPSSAGAPALIHLPEATGGGIPTGMQTPGGTPMGGGNLHARLVATLADVSRPGALSAAAGPSTDAMKASAAGSSAAWLRPVSSAPALPRVAPRRASAAEVKAVVKHSYASPSAMLWAASGAAGDGCGRVAAAAAAVRRVGGASPAHISTKKLPPGDGELPTAVPTTARAAARKPNRPSSLCDHSRFGETFVSLPYANRSKPEVAPRSVYRDTHRYASWRG